MAPKIQLVMTVWNREKYLRTAIESVLSQSFADWELIVWDNYSTDSSTKIIEEFVARDSRIKAVYHSQNIGHPGALRIALADNTSDYLGWVDSDDILAPTALAETIALMDADRDCGMVYSQYMNIDAQGKELGIGSICLLSYHHNRLLTTFICHHFRLVRRSCYDLVGGVRADCWYAEDYDLALKLSEVTKIIQLRKPLYYYRRHVESLSGTGPEALVTASASYVREALIRRGYDKLFKLVVGEDSSFRLERVGAKK